MNFKILFDPVIGRVFPNVVDDKIYVYTAEGWIAVDFGASNHLSLEERYNLIQRA